MAAAGLRQPLELDPGAFNRRVRFTLLFFILHLGWSTATPTHAQRAPIEAFALKQAMHRTHFVLGGAPPRSSNSSNSDSEEEEEEEEDGKGVEEEGGMYAPASRQPDPRAIIGGEGEGGVEWYRGRLNAEVRARIKASSVHWGEDTLR